MDQRLNWSLVLLVFILASHITDASARHHHIKLRHARHRRQHGESYLPASFVLDTDEEESGTWGPWSAPSSCSRSCGGGVAHQTRTCQDIDESTQIEFCTGARKRFFSCNVQECPEPTQDFRAEQCAEFNNVPIEGVYYDWIPYTGGPNKCELNCMPRGQRFFYRHRLSVTDGTPCTAEKNDVCVQGKCRPVGCDMMLGSDAKEDRCRECGGDGSACNTVRGLLDMDDLQVGYNDILLIPEGATNIAISEVRPSSNYLAIRNASGHYYLNGNWRIDFPRSLRFAGSVFHYERRPKEFSAADIINALGPTSEAIYIVLLYQDTNVGVNYEYSVPQRFAKQSKPDSYTWVVEEFSNCSVECGGGIQSRLVRCVKRGDNEEADASLCDQQLEPDSTQACNVEPCPPEWVVKGWGPCSKQCGPGGEQSREIQCEQVISGGIASLVDDHQCLEMIGPKEIQIQECNKDVECPQWHIGPWKPCDRLCGKGKQTRKITCYKKEEGKIIVLDDSACEEERPESDNPCELRPCAGVDWVVSKWSGCDDNCGLTQETRTTSCVTLEGEVYPDSQCNAETKPKLVRECSAQEKCAFQWYATQWSECSAKCGTGIQTRKVFCGTSPSGNEGIKEVDDGKCDPSKKYNTTKDCTAEIEECKGEWFAGPWTECSKPCGGGEMTRKVVCMKDNKVVPIKGNCYDSDIMFSIDDCNKEACNEDETIPLEPGNINAPIEDDEEECEDYQDDGFEPVDSNLDVVDPESDDRKDEDASPLSSSSDGKLSGYSLDEIMLGDDPETYLGDDQESSGDNESSGDDESGIDDNYSEGSGTESTSDSTSSFSTSETESTESPETVETDETGSTDITESSITDSTSSETSVTPESSTSTPSPTTTSHPKTHKPFPSFIIEGAFPVLTTISPSEGTSSTISSSEEPGSTTDSESTSNTESTASLETLGIDQTSSTVTTESTESGSSSSDGTGSTSSESSVSPESSVSLDTSSTSSSDTTVLSSSDTTESSSSDTTVSSSSETPGSSSSDTTQSSSSDTTAQSSSGTTISSSSDTTVSFSSDTTESSSSDTTVLSSSETPGSSSSGATESSSSSATHSSSSETSGSSSLDTTESSSSATTESSSSETTESSSSDTTDTSSSGTTESSSSVTTEPSSSDTTQSSSSETSGSSTGSDRTESSSSETSGLSSSDTTESSTTVSSSSETSGSSSSDTTESSSSGTTQSSSSETSGSSSSDTTVSSSSETVGSSSSVTTESSSSETLGLSSSDTTESSSSGTTLSSSSETSGSSSSDTTESSSSGTTLSSSSETSGSSGSDTTESSSSGTTLSSSSETSGSSSSDTTESSSSGTTLSSSSETSGSSSSDTTESSSSGTTLSSSSETSGSSSSDTTESSSSGTTLSSSSETSGSSSSDTTESSSSDTTLSSSSETSGSSSSDTTESSSSGTTLSSSSETSGSSSSDTTESSSSAITESSSSEATESSSSETTGSSISTETTELSSSQSTESSSSETTISSTSDTTTSESPSASTATMESSLSTDITEETSESDFTTDVTTESNTTGDTTESGITETDEDLDTTEQSHITDIWTTTSSPSTKRLRKCRPRKPKTCKSSPFGCCYDGVKAATGPFGKGCPVPKTCKETEFGCCPDEVSPATGPDNQGCPDSHCSETLFGCCPDNVTPSEGNDYEGCPIPCDESEFGCCPDGKTHASGKHNMGCCNGTAYGCCPNGIEPASGPDGEGCDEKETSTISTSESEITSESSSTVEISSTSEVEGTTTSGVETTTTSETEITTVGGTEETITDNCTASYYGCCADGVSPALGENGQGCHTACEDSIFGCCDDGSTPAHGPNKEGCCLATPYGCCPDNIRHVQGPNLYGCGCQYSRYGCCPDNKTTAGGPNNEGCACEYTPHGCCPNRITAASGPNFEGCACHTYQFGCCPDGISIARGPQQLGCGCENSEFKCCSDGITPAKGENYAGCTCDSSKYGCCPDGDEEAQGENFEGCLTVPSNPGAACALERDRGTCTEFSVRWFFDTEYGGCSRFWYGGCEGNENRFKSQEECKEICVEPKGRDACFLPKISGPCEEYHPMWYYDSERKQCGQFVYKGCLGNANKFKTREECEGLCDIPDDIDPCEQEKEVGPCEGNFTRWYFNKDTDSCEEFSYGGCKGNKNNFRSEISCHQQCLPAGQSRVQDVCALEKEPGPCPGSLLRWYYDSKRKSCRQFVFGGCKGNGNKFRTYAACEQRCPIRDSCSLPREEGSCTEKHARWFFDQSENRCLPFYYTGCGGNKNNFETRDACDSDCPSKIEQETCLLPALLGECYNYTKRWYYDSYEERCRQFYYGGCGGNGNNFETEDACTNRCRPSPTTPPPITTTLASTTPPPAREFRTESCFLGEDYGPCTEDSIKWFYDSRDGICKQFRYGGCAGNENKFDTPEECENRCGNVQDLCGLPAVVGPCRAAIPKYYYDSRTDSCYEFIYGGCQGNKNNFYDKESCEQRCRKSSEVTTKIVPTAAPATESPPKSATCSLPRDPGPCNNDITAYFYDEKSGACQAFLYGGCEGNANRFQTEEQCERLCGSFQGQDVCNIPSNPGPCLGAFRKFYYDPNTRRCHEFLYGGCDGNANRFTSTEECESVCIHREEPPVPGNGTVISDLEICNEPVSVGSCSPGSYKRFYYSDERLNCIAFIYTGCGGNRNRFKNYDSCMKTCYSPINEVDVGPDEPEHKDPCLAARLECNTIRCPYGTEDYVDDQNCQHCRCADPCRTEICPEGSKCAISLVAQGDFVGYQSVCRAILKPGNCPKVSNASRCEQECSSDADCSDDLKCCASGCGTSCLRPAPTEPTTTPAPEVGFTVPYHGAEPAAIQQPEEPNVRAEEGGYVTLPCSCTGNPRPIITWRRGVTLIDNSLDRHSIGVEGSLQIVNLYTTDAGIYTCTADNHLAAPVRIQYELYITEAQEHSPVILGEPDYRVTVTLNSPAILPCNAIGWPRPQVTWWHEERLLPMSQGLYALQRDNSLRIRRVDLSNLGVYTCQAFNGIHRPTSWSVTLLAPGPVYNLSPENQKYTKYLIEPQRRPVSSTVRPQYPYRPETTKAPETRTYAPVIPDRRPPYIPPVVTLPPPEIVPGPRIVPVRVSVSTDKGPFPERSEFNISCNVDGFPVPRVIWSKDDVPLQPNNRITILQDNTLLISDADKSDSGKYRCQAGNEFSSAEDSVDIEVAGIYIHPNCKDTQFYARCDLIVKAKFCHHKYYAKFCCRSCTEAGQLPVRGPHINETRRKRRSIFSFL